MVPGIELPSSLTRILNGTDPGECRLVQESLVSGLRYSGPWLGLAHEEILRQEAIIGNRTRLTTWFWYRVEYR